MPANAVVTARIDDKTKKKAAAVLKSMGLTPSVVFRHMMTRIATEKALPFSLIPNAETIEALEEARRDNINSYDTIEELMAALMSDDED